MSGVRDITVKELVEFLNTCPQDLAISLQHKNKRFAIKKMKITHFFVGLRLKLVEEAEAQ